MTQAQIGMPSCDLGWFHPKGLSSQRPYSLTKTLVRAGIDICLDDMEVKCAVHRPSGSGAERREYFDHFVTARPIATALMVMSRERLRACTEDASVTPPRHPAQVSQWQGEITNREPEKCSEVRFFHKDKLPASTLAFVRFALDSMDRGEPFVEHGW